MYIKKNQNLTLFSLAIFLTAGVAKAPREEEEWDNPEDAVATDGFVGTAADCATGLGGGGKVSAADVSSVMGSFSWVSSAKNQKEILAVYQN